MQSETKKKRDREYSRQWRKGNPDKIKAYLERTKDRRAKKAKEYRKDNREECLKYDKEYYEKNRESRIKKSNEIQRLKGHPCEKTPERRKRANIRKQTRRKYPLGDNTCNFCDNKATQHHHTTDPITVDDFDFVCNKHHNKHHDKRTFANVGSGE